MWPQGNRRNRLHATQPTPTQKDNTIVLSSGQSFCNFCNEAYGRESTIPLSCGIHRVHKNCAQADGVCRDCLPSTDVLPLGEPSFLAWCGSIFCHEAEELQVHGVASLSGSDIDYALISTHIDQREKFWYSVADLGRKFGDFKVKSALKKFMQ